MDNVNETRLSQDSSLIPVTVKYSWEKPTQNFQIGTVFVPKTTPENEIKKAALAEAKKCYRAKQREGEELAWFKDAPQNVDDVTITIG